MTPADLYSRILPFVPGCPEAMVDQVVIDSVVELAEFSQAIFELSTTIPLVNGTATYSVVDAGGLELDLVRFVLGPGNRELTPLSSPGQLQDVLPNWQGDSSNEPTHYSAWSTPESLTVYPTPAQIAAGASLRVHGTWKPSLTATSFPDSLGRSYYQTIVEGAKSKLMLMPDKKWSNPQLAAISDKKFRDGMVDAKNEALHGKVAGSISVRPARFGGV